jgi:DNA-binding transcriptional LysR family regulator
MNLNDLLTFVRVAETGSFTRVAGELGVPKSTVSRRVVRLEEALGLELIVRGPRGLHVTEHGAILRDRCSPALREIADVERAVVDAGEVPRGLLRVTAPKDLGTTLLFANLLGQFRSRYPEVTLELDLGTRRVDLVEEGFDVALRVHSDKLPDTSGLMMRQLGAVVGGLFASPAYLQRRSKPKKLSDLGKHECVCAGGSRGPVRWRLLRDESDEEVEIRPTPTMIANDYAFVLSALLAGTGVGLLPTFLAEPHVARGELVRVLPSARTAQGIVSLVWPATRHLSPRVRAFIDFMSEQTRTGVLTLRDVAA